MTLTLFVRVEETQIRRWMQQMEAKACLCAHAHKRMHIHGNNLLFHYEALKLLYTKRSKRHKNALCLYNP